MGSVLGHLWFWGGLNKAKSSAGRKDSFATFGPYGAIGFNILYTLEFFLTYILRVVTLSSLNLSAFRHLQSVCT